MIFRQLFDTTSSTYTYLLGCPETREAIIIDSVFEQHQRDTALIRELGLTIKYVLDTHVHADHVTGAWLMKEAYNAQIVLAEVYDAEGVDVALGDGMVLTFGRCAVTAHAVPGHTNGCFAFVTHDKRMVFPGDTLLIRGAGRTDFQSGDVHTMWRSIHEKIFSLPDDCLIYPGHDYMGRTVSTVAEEKKFNPRIGGDAREEDFAGFMDNLGLPHPKLLEIAVPANMKCGKPETPVEKIDWGPVTLTFAGIPEIEPDWVARHLESLFVLDVRSASEYEGELGHIEPSTVIPLSELRDRIGEISTSAPIVAVCQSGKRSAMAVQILRNSGFERVANIPGGVIQWGRLGLPGLVVPENQYETWTI